MKTAIRSTGISTDSNVTSSVEHAAIAGKKCIEAAGIDTQEIDYLFNVGIYRDSNMVEPSMAALIQKKIGLNPDFIKSPVRSTAFSTDLMNGAAGALNAFHVADAIFKAGNQGFVLVVSSDAHPSGRPHEGFPVNACGAAVLLECSQDGRGFECFSFRGSDSDYIGESSFVDFQKHGLNGCDSIAVDAKPDYYERLLDFAVESARQFILHNGIDVHSTALIAPAFNSHFSTGLSDRLEFRRSDVVDVWPDYGNPHTSTIGIGLDVLRRREDLGKYAQLLIVGAGAGLHTGCALYRLK